MSKGAGWKTCPMLGISGAQLSFSGMPGSSGAQMSFSETALLSNGVVGWHGVFGWDQGVACRLEPPWLLELSPQSLSFMK